MSMERLKGSRCYLAGPIDHCKNDGTDWRKDITSFLEHLGIIALDPTNKPIKNTSLQEVPDEIGAEKAENKAIRTKGDFEELHRRAKIIRHVDLRMTDVADFIVALIDQNIPMCGTWEEIANVNRQKKPVICVILPYEGNSDWRTGKGGPYDAPLWLHGMLHHRFFYHDFQSVKQYIKLVHDGGVLGVPAVDQRWTLLDFDKLH